MFVTNKQIDVPGEVLITTNSIELKIKVVNSFKLLGITLDNKLSFQQFAADTSLKINKRLYSIRRLFYLATSVKLQFFKTFILPIFDYCLSLIIYMPKIIIQKLCNIYYTCLFKLFKFNFVHMNISTINDYLFKYNLFSFQHRVVYRLLLFIHKVMNGKHKPINLCNLLKSNTDRNLKYNLRNSNELATPTLQNSYGELTFTYFFTKFINKICVYEISLDFITFKKLVIKDLDSILTNLTILFPRFDIMCKYFN